MNIYGFLLVTESGTANSLRPLAMEVNAGFQFELSANKDVIFSQASKLTDPRIRRPTTVPPVLEFTSGVSCGFRNASGIFIHHQAQHPRGPLSSSWLQLITLLMALWSLGPHASFPLCSGLLPPLLGPPIPSSVLKGSLCFLAPSIICILMTLRQLWPRPLPLDQPQIRLPTAAPTPGQAPILAGCSESYDLLSRRCLPVPHSLPSGIQ